MLTIQSDVFARTEIEVKRSRFLGLAARADSPEQAREVIASQRTAYPDARHHCTAYIVRVPGANPIMHSSDDGEPSGTAGTPMLNVLRHSGLENVVVVVTRYFGGTLLGTGGLVRAYSDSTRLTLEEAPKVQIKTRNLYMAEIDLTVGGRVEAEFRSAGFDIHNAEWGRTMKLTIIAKEKTDIDRRLSELTHSSATFQLVGTIDAVESI